MVTVSTKKDGETCYFCGETDRLEEHHIVPRRYRGSNEDESLVTLCSDCHVKIEQLYDDRFYRRIKHYLLHRWGKRADCNDCLVCYRGSKPSPYKKKLAEKIAAIDDELGL